VVDAIRSGSDHLRNHNNRNATSNNISKMSDLLSVFDNGEYSEFLKRYELEITPDIESEKLQIARGVAFLRTGDPQKASNILKEVIAKNPANNEALIFNTGLGRDLLIHY
jgi:tetratricopeptide (TPR) repeat protein